MTTFHRVMETFIRNEGNEIILFYEILQNTRLLIKREFDENENKLNSINFILLSHNKETLICCVVEIKIHSIYHRNDFL